MSSLPEDQVIVQLAISPKGLDATAITAGEAMRNLLGLREQLADVRRQRWLECTLRVLPEVSEPRIRQVEGEVDRYLDQSFALFNSNKERCWVRTIARIPGEAEPTVSSAEFDPANGRRSSRWGDPALDRDGWDHLVLWEPERAAAPADFPSRFGDADRVELAAGEVYSFRWGSEESEGGRRELIEKVAVVRGRDQGLLVQPHYQDHTIHLGPLGFGLGRMQLSSAGRVRVE